MRCSFRFRRSRSCSSVSLFCPSLWLLSEPEPSLSVTKKKEISIYFPPIVIYHKKYTHDNVNMAVVVFYSQYLIFNLYKPNNPSRQFLKLNFNLICKIVIFFIYIYLMLYLNMQFIKYNYLNSFSF